MNFRLTTIGLALAFATLVQAQTEDVAPPADNPQGTIILYDKDNASCALPVPPEGSGITVTYSFTADGSPCKALQNKVRSVIFSNLQSAVNIIMTDNDECRMKHVSGADIPDFWIQLRTTAQHTSTPQIQLPTFYSYRPGQLIERGVQVLGHFIYGDKVIDKMSCLRVKASQGIPSATSGTPQP
ncbi:hypothetical protein [Pseudomonas japonica]|uniref:Uncharacterized protein n=1 Tax=Pseudomonas japonica TaxID=256466 RepID=A0A239GRM1_9PSED|nr:hypothetical protein [Pseudomonas japonica]SNS71790.1 hypothetical protein SAMN05444352_113129 [Pseudomonas japonica]